MADDIKYDWKFFVGLILTLITIVSFTIVLFLTADRVTKETSLCIDLNYHFTRHGLTKSGAYCYNILPGMIEQRYYMYTNKTMQVNPYGQ